MIGYYGYDISSHSYVATT